MTGTNETEGGATVAQDTTGRWLSRQELAARWGVPSKSLAQWACNGTGPPYARFGKHVRYKLSDVTAWEDAQLAKRAIG
jgi:hypothetical protein